MDIDTRCLASYFQIAHLNIFRTVVACNCYMVLLNFIIELHPAGLCTMVSISVIKRPLFAKMM